MLHRAVLFLLLFLMTATAAISQQIIVSGKVIDSSGTAMEGASVKLRHDKDSTGVITGKNGLFSLQLTSDKALTLQVSSIGYVTIVKTYKHLTPKINAGNIRMAQDARLMEEVVVTSVNPITVKEDTIEYKASAYKVRDGAPVEDVIKKLPGITVDKDGAITAQGKAVARVRVNGKDFFGGDVQTATQNLPADIIDNIQIIDDYGDMANLTGIKSGEPEKIININVRKDRNRGKFGNATIAAGNEGRYAAGLVAN
ncbi:MAG: carboxypeptidase-like regulatory domain-containing protein, partial [Chitinophagaceae bacterium]